MTTNRRSQRDTQSPLTEQLKSKSRDRREDLTHMARPGGTARAARNDVLPILELVRIGIDDLKTAQRKVRKKDPTHVREVAATISELGFCDPVLIGKDNLVLDGEIRVEAARLIGLASVPAIRIDHLSPAEQRLLRLAVNRLGEKGQWDLAELKIEFEELVLEDAPIEIVGFSVPEIDQILLDDEVAAVEQGPLAPEPDVHPVARVGDHFILGRHELICGDATDPRVLERLMHEDRAQLLLSDEPYNVEIRGNVTRGAHREFVMASGRIGSSTSSMTPGWRPACLTFATGPCSVPSLTGAVTRRSTLQRPRSA